MLQPAPRLSLNVPCPSSRILDVVEDIAHCGLLRYLANEYDGGREVVLHIFKVPGYVCLGLRPVIDGMLDDAFLGIYLFTCGYFDACSRVSCTNHLRG